VTAVDDTVIEEVHISTITHSVASADGDYNGLAISGITVVIADNNSPPITLVIGGGGGVPAPIARSQSVSV